MARRAITFAFAIAVLLVAGGLWFILSGRASKVPQEEALARTRQLVGRAGGTARICEEAGTLFHRFDRTKLSFFRPRDLDDFPSIKALGKVDGVWPTGIIVPPGICYIKVRVGNHFRGFMIHIFDPELDQSTATDLHEVQVDRCIYVQN